MEQAKREAWYRARYELAGPTNWTHYWDAARRARGFKGLPKWMLDLEMNWRVPPPEVMEQQEAPPAQYPPEGTFQTGPGPAPQYPQPVYPPDDRVYSRPGSNQPVDPGVSRLGSGPIVGPGIYRRPGPQPGATQTPPRNPDLLQRGRPQVAPMPMPAYPLPGPPDQYLELLGQVAISRPSPQYAQPAMADPRVAQRMRLEELAARQAEIDRATPGLLKDRAQKAWDQRRRARKARIKRASKDRR